MRKLASLSLIAAVSCGEVKVNKLPDANTDAPADGTPHGVVTVKVLDPTGNGAPAVGAPVVFIDSAQTQKVATDNTGKASADVLAGASVSAVVDESGSTLVETILGVQPGDSLTLGDVNNATDPPAGTYIVNFPGVAGDNYSIFGPCGAAFVSAAPFTATLNMTKSCLLNPMDLLITVSDAAGNQLGYVEQPNTTFVSGGSSTLNTNVLSGFSTFSATYTNLAGVGSVNIQRLAPDGFGFFAGSGAPVAGATLPLSMPVPLTANALVQSAFQQANATNSIQRVTQTIPGNATTFGVDTDGTLLGWIGAPTVDVVTNQVTIPYDQTQTTQDASDIFFTEFAVTRPPATDAGTSQSFLWLVFEATPTTFTLPQLPPEIGDVNPKAGDTVGFSAAGALETDGFADYTPARQDPFAAFESLAFGTPNRLPAGTTKVRFSQSPQLDIAGSHRHMSRR